MKGINVMLLKNYFCCTVPTDIKMSTDDLRRLSVLVRDIKLLRASNGRKYGYFFPSDDHSVDSIQQMLAKYNIFGTKHVSHYDWYNKNIVRVRCRTQKQSETIKSFADDVLAIKNGLEEVNALSR